jgi:hypothetical protein
LINGEAPERSFTTSGLSYPASERADSPPTGVGRALLTRTFGAGLERARRMRQAGSGGRLPYGAASADWTEAKRQAQTLAALDDLFGIVWRSARDFGIAVSRAPLDRLRA